MAQPQLIGGKVRSSGACSPAIQPVVINSSSCQHSLSILFFLLLTTVNVKDSFFRSIKSWNIEGLWRVLSNLWDYYLRRLEKRIQLGDDMCACGSCSRWNMNPPVTGGVFLYQGFMHRCPTVCIVLVLSPHRFTLVILEIVHK